MQEANCVVSERRKPGPKPADDLTAHQSRTLRSIKEFISEHGFPPTVAELSESIGVTGATVHDQISRLIRKGYLRRDDRKARGLVVVGDLFEPTMSLLTIPLVGGTHARQPITATGSIVGEIAVDSRIIRGGVHFAMTVRGDSMRNAGIEDGDIVIVRRQSVAASGDIVVALLGDEANVRRLYVRGRRIELQAENSAYAPVLIEPDSDMRIVGEVVGVGHRSPR